MPHAIDRLFASPKITAVLPFKSVMFDSFDHSG
jgi:hypothetical protein